MNEVTTIERPSVSLSLPKGLPFYQWVEMGRRLCASSQVVNWHIGDWWNFGTKKYGLEQAARGAREIWGVASETARKCGWVADKFPPVRRRTELPFTHYEEVASLAEGGLAAMLLERAEAEGLSKRELRREVSALRTAERIERKLDVIDIRPVREPEEAEIISADEIILELATELCKLRTLTERESGFLERALRRIARNDGRRTEEWTGELDVEMIVMLKEGKRPRHIAPLIDRTEGAVWRRIHKLGGIQNLVAQGSVEEWPIRKV